MKIEILSHEEVIKKFVDKVHMELSIEEARNLYFVFEAASHRDLKAYCTDHKGVKLYILEDFISKLQDILDATDIWGL